MTRKRHLWKLKTREIQLGDRTLIMGILNVTPDSFSDGGRYMDPDRAFARAIELEDEGADLIDIGAESTRPGSTRITEAEELRRLVPVLKRLKDKLGVPICVDTYKAAVAEKALEYGAEIINDPSGLTWDPALAKVVAKHDAGLVLNHMRGTPETWAKLPPIKDVGGTVAAELEATIHRATKSGVRHDRIVIDLGLGFGKRKEQNTELIARLPQFVALNTPILIGPSRKSFLARQDERETSYANAAAVTASILGGAHILRVHEVLEMRIAAQLADAVTNAITEADERPRTERAGPRGEVPPEQAPGAAAGPPAKPDRSFIRGRVVAPERPPAPPRLIQDRPPAGRPPAQERDRSPERDARSQRPERNGPPDRRGTSNRGPRPDRSGPPGRTGRPERSGPPDRRGTSNRGPRPDRSGPPSRSGRPERSGPPGRSPRPDADRPSNRGGRPGTSGRPDRPGQGRPPNRGDRPDRGGPKRPWTPGGGRKR